MVSLLNQLFCEQYVYFISKPNARNNLRGNNIPIRFLAGEDVAAVYVKSSSLQLILLSFCNFKVMLNTEHILLKQLHTSNCIPKLVFLADALLLNSPILLFMFSKGPIMEVSPQVTYSSNAAWINSYCS